MLNWLNGKKTYLAAASFAAFAIGGFWFGQIDAVQLGVALSIALGASGFGHKLDKQKDVLVDSLTELRAANQARLAAKK